MNPSTSRFTDALRNQSQGGLPPTPLSFSRRVQGHGPMDDSEDVQVDGEGEGEVDHQSHPTDLDLDDTELHHQDHPSSTAAASAASTNTHTTTTTTTTTSARAKPTGRKPISTSFSMAPMTTTTVVTTTTTTSTEYPPLFFKPPPIPAHLDPKLFPLADTPTPPALKKFCFDLNGQPTYFRENQDAEKTMGQLEDALYNLSASAHRAALQSQKQRKNQFQDQAVATTTSRKSISMPDTTILHPVPTGMGYGARKRPASPNTPIQQVDPMVGEKILASGGNSDMILTPDNHDRATEKMSLAMLQQRQMAFRLSSVDRSSPPHKKPKGPATKPWGQPSPTAPTFTSPSGSSRTTPGRGMSSSASAPMLTDLAATPSRLPLNSTGNSGYFSTALEPSNLPSPSLSPTTALNAAGHLYRSASREAALSGHRRSITLPSASHDVNESDDPSQEQEDMVDVETTVPSSQELTATSHVPSLLDLPSLVATFDSLPSNLQSYMLFHLLRRSPAPTLQFVSSVIMATLKQDFLGSLPFELSLNILRFLDIKTLCRAAQVSKQWRVVVDSESQIWLNRFNKDGFQLEDNEEEEAAQQRLGIDGYYGARPRNHSRRHTNAAARLAAQKGKARLTTQAPVVRHSDLPESPMYPGDVTMKEDEDLQELESSMMVVRGGGSSVSKSQGGSSRRNNTHLLETGVTGSSLGLGEPMDETFLGSDAAPPSPTTSHAGDFLPGLDSEDETMMDTDTEKLSTVGPMHPSTPHPYKALYRRHWLIRQNWAKGRAKHIKFTGHAHNVVTCLQFDSEKIISGSDDHCIHVYNTVTGDRLKKLEGHEGGVWALQYRGNTLVSGSTDRTVRIWDITAGICTHTFHGHTSTVRCLQIVMPVNVNKDPRGVPKYEPEFPVIVTGSRDATLRVWRLPDPNNEAHQNQPDSYWLLHTLVGHTHSVRALAAEGSTLVSGSYDFAVRVWNLWTGSQVHILRGHTQKVYSVVLDSERSQCMSGSMDASVRIWSLEDGSCLHTLEGHTSLVGLLGLNANHLVSAAADCTVRIWDPSRGVCLRILAGHTNAITCFQHDGWKVISGSDGNLKMWDFQSGKFLRNLLTDLSKVWQVKFDERRCVAAVQRDEVTYFEVLDYGYYGVEEPLENAPAVAPVEIVGSGTSAATATGATTTTTVPGTVAGDAGAQAAVAQPV